MTEVVAMVCGQGKMCTENQSRETTSCLASYGHNTCTSFLPHVPSPGLSGNPPVLVRHSPSADTARLGARAEIPVVNYCY